MRWRTDGEESVEAIAYRKVTRRVIPLMFVCYICAMLDRVNVGFAKLQMAADLGFSDTVFGFGAGIFFIGYFFFEVPSNLLLQKLGARIWIARIMLVWGLISMTTALVPNAPWFYAVRFLLGVAEAGFFPGIILYLTYWYTQKHRVRMVAGFMTANPLSNVVGGPLSGWIMEAFAGKHGLAGWQWLFILEGIPSLVMGVVVLLVLNNGPKDAGWLSAEEKEIVLRRLAEEQMERKGVGHAHTLADAFRSGKVWVLSAVYFGAVMGIYGMAFWLPQIVEDMGVKSTRTIGLITAIPWAIAAVSMVLVGRHSDKTQERRWHVALAALAGAIGFVLAALLGESAVASLAALTLAIVGIMCVLSTFWALPTALLSGTAAAAGIALINSVGNLAGHVSPSVVGWIRDVTGQVTWGMYVLAASMAMSCVLVLLLPREPRSQPYPTSTDSH